jgi:hypothetical protein
VDAVTSAFRLEPYHPRHLEPWNALVRASKNGTFLHERGYVDYHADRFTDASVVAWDGDDGRPVAVLAANRATMADGDWLISHGGLTYGGWVTDQRMTAAGMVKLFELLGGALREQGYAGLIYKVVPRVFHRTWADEDLYALFVSGAQASRIEAGAAIDLKSPLGWSKGKKHSLSKARRAGVRVAESDDFERFVDLLASVLQRHGTRPVHTPDELRLLTSRFPGRIRLFTAVAGGEPAMISAVLAYDFGHAVHVQYMASSEQGREIGGLEAIFDALVSQIFPDRSAISLGISTEAGGRVLNEGLMRQKEMFGARTVAHLTFSWRMAD